MYATQDQFIFNIVNLLITTNGFCNVQHYSINVHKILNKPYLWTVKFMRKSYKRLYNCKATIIQHII